MSKKIIGMLGGGQLGRMTAFAAEKLDIKLHVYTQEERGPTAQVAYKTSIGDFLDEEALKKFAEEVDVITFESENIPHKTLEILEKYKPVHPNSDVIKICQNRIREKDFVNNLGIGTAPYQEVNNRDELEAAVRKIGTPCILKTTEMGYDGKGQQKLQNLLSQAVLEENTQYVLEGFVPFEKEISVIVARTESGQTACYDAVENDHKNHILDVTKAPANISDELNEKAKDMAIKIADGMKLIGVLAVEMFVVGDDLLVNELAPRPHNSGHHTIDSCETSQFEQFVRAITGMDLGSTKLHTKAEMINIIGDEIDDISKYESDPNCKIHVYGKRETRPGRKMAHVTKLLT